VSKKKMTAVLLSLGSASALAGTMGAVEPVVNNFDGFYVGLGSGLSTLFEKHNYSSVESDGHNNFSSSSKDAASSTLFTGTLGYGKMFAEKTYLGAKFSTYYSPAERRYSSAHSDIYRDHQNVYISHFSRSFMPTYNLDLMLGYEVIPNFLPFVEGGVSFSDFRVKTTHNVSRTALVGGSTISYSNNLSTGGYNTNWNVGIGGYYLVDKNWFFSTDLVYTDHGSHSASFLETSHAAFDGNTETLSHSVSTSAVNLFFGVNYLFNL